MSSYDSSRPDAQLFEGQEEEQVDRELPDDIMRRQVINNLAKHVLFSKTLTTTQPVHLLHPIDVFSGLISALYVFSS